MKSLNMKTRLGGASSQGPAAGNVSGRADLVGRGLARSGYCSESSKRPQKLRVATLNVGTMKGRASEVVETVSRRGVDLCCLQETRYKGNTPFFITGKDSRYKCFPSSNSKGTGGVCILLAEKWVDKVYEVQRISDRILLLKMIVGSFVHSFLCLYAPQVGLSAAEKDRFYDQLQTVAAKIPQSEVLIPCGDWNGHVGAAAAGFEEVHGGHGWGVRNAEGERVLEFAVANDLIVCNTWFMKRASHRITYQSGDSSTQVDYIMYRKSLRRHVVNAKVIPGEEAATQHKLLVCDIKVVVPPQPKSKFVPRVKTWKLRDALKQAEFQDSFTRNVNETATTTEELWATLKSGLLNSAEQVCGLSKEHRWRKQTWWWSKHVDNAIQEKRRCYKVWKRGGSREAYNTAKRVAKSAVYQAKLEAGKSVFEGIDPDSADIYKVAKQMRRENQDVVGEKPVKNDLGELSLDDTSKQRAWKEHYERLLNVEFPWNPEDLSDELPVEGPAVPVTEEMISKAIGKMKFGKAAGPSGIVAEMLKSAGDTGVAIMRNLVESIIREGRIPTDWEESHIVSLYKGKGEALDRGNYRGLKLLDQAMKVLERVVDKLIRERVSIDEMQFGFMPGRGTTDAIFIVRQMQEKYLTANKTLYMAFIDLEKAFDRVPREVIWWSLRKLGVDEWLVRLVQSMYANVHSRARVGSGYSDVFPVKVGVHQGSVLSPLLFIIVLEALSRECRTGCPWEDLYADDLAIIAESLKELSEKVEAWRGEMEKKGLRVNMGKTKVLVSGANLNVLKDSGKFPCAVCRSGAGSNSIFCRGCSHWVHKKCSGIKGRLVNDPEFKCARCLHLARPLDGRPVTEVEVGECKLEVVSSFCYLGDTICAGGGCELATITRAKSAWGKFRMLLPILSSRQISLATRGKVYSTCVRSTMLHASETWAMSSSALNRLQRNDRAMMRWMCNVRPEDDIGSDAVLSMLGIEDLSSIIRRTRLRWFGHVERSEGWINRVRKLKIESKKGPGRPKKTWEECVRNDRVVMGMAAINPCDRLAWRGRLRQAKRALPSVED